MKLREGKRKKTDERVTSTRKKEKEENGCGRDRADVDISSPILRATSERSSGHFASENIFDSRPGREKKKVEKKNVVVVSQDLVQVRRWGWRKRRRRRKRQTSPSRPASSVLTKLSENLHAQRMPTDKPPPGYTDKRLPTCRPRGLYTTYFYWAEIRWVSRRPDLWTAVHVMPDSYKNLNGAYLSPTTEIHGEANNIPMHVHGERETERDESVGSRDGRTCLGYC